MQTRLSTAVDVNLDRGRDRDNRNAEGRFRDLLRLTPVLEWTFETECMLDLSRCSTAMKEGK